MRTGTAALIVGYVGTLVTDIQRDKRAHKAADDARRAARLEINEDRRRDFDLQKLMQASDASTELQRATSALRFDAAATRSNRTPAVVRFRQALQDLNTAIGFVLDKEVRELLERSRVANAVLGRAHLKRNVGESGGAERGADLSEEMIEAAGDAILAAKAALSARVRTLYDESVTTS